MAYYAGKDIEHDLKCATEGVPPQAVYLLYELGVKVGFGSCQQILQLLWAKELKDTGKPTQCAWGPVGTEFP